MAAEGCASAARWLGPLGGFLLAAAALAPSLAGRTVFFPAELWMGSVPFALSGPEARSHAVHNPLSTDRAFLFGPHAAVAHRELRGGALPLWNRYVRAGEPSLQNGDSWPLHPLNLPIVLLPWPLGFAWAAWLRFGLMWLGGWSWARAIGLGRGGSAALAIGFAFAPGFLANFEQPRAVAHVGLPWLLFASERLAAAAGRPALAQLRAALPLAGVELLVATNGYLPAAFNVSFAAALYLLLRLPLRPRSAALGTRAAGLAALGLGVALAAPVLLPSLAFLRGSVTLAERQGAGGWTFPGETLRLFWDPWALGSPLAGAVHPWTGRYNFEEQQQYVGLLPWVFLLGALPRIARRARAAPDDARRLVALGAIAFVCAALAFGWPPLHGWLSALPPLSVNSNPRLLFVTQVFVVALAVLASRAGLGGRPHARAFAVLAAAAAAGGAATAALGLARAWPARPFVALAAAVLLLAAGRFAASRAQRRAAHALLPLLLLAEVAPVYRGYYAQPLRDQADPARAASRLPTPLRDDPRPRVVFENFTPPNLPGVFGVEDVRAYGFPVPARYDAFMREVLEVEEPETLMRADLERPEVLRGLERTCAGWLFTSARFVDGEPRGLEPAWRRGPLALYRLREASPCVAWYADGGVERALDLGAATARMRAALGESPEPVIVEHAAAAATPAASAAAPAAAAWRWDGPNALDIEVPAAARERDGWLVARVSFDAGWRAFAEGRELEIAPAQVRFLAVRTPAGTDRVRLRYRPPHFASGVAIAAAALALAAWLARAGRRATVRAAGGAG